MTRETALELLGFPSSGPTPSRRQTDIRFDELLRTGTINADNFAKFESARKELQRGKALEDLGFPPEASPMRAEIKRRYEELERTLAGNDDPFASSELATYWEASQFLLGLPQTS